MQLVSFRYLVSVAEIRLFEVREYAESDFKKTAIKVLSSQYLSNSEPSLKIQNTNHTSTYIDLYV